MPLHMLHIPIVRAALQTQVIRFHSCHVTLLELIRKQCALSDSLSDCRELSVMLIYDALHAITAKDYGSPTQDMS